MDAIALLRQWMGESVRAVFFGGAGVSTESGIPDFRGVDGLYRQRYETPPEVMLSAEYFFTQPEAFYRFYRERVLAPEALPNAAHRGLAAWERRGGLTAVVTQNIDGLHQAAGSRKVLELHGSVHRNHCMGCKRAYGLAAILESRDAPRCVCGGIIRPDVVLYGEQLPARVWEQAVRVIGEADLLVVGGTSLSVYPAAGLIDLYQGKRLVLVNQTPTPRDAQVDLVLREPIGAVFKALTEE